MEGAGGTEGTVVAEGAAATEGVGAEGDGAEGTCLTTFLCAQPAPSTTTTATRAPCRFMVELFQLSHESARFFSFVIMRLVTKLT